MAGEMVDADGAVLGFRTYGGEVVTAPMPCNMFDGVPDRNLYCYVGEMRRCDGAAPFRRRLFLGLAVG